MKTVTLSLLALVYSAIPAMAEPLEPASVRIIDGDTIAVDGRKPNIRLGRVLIKNACWKALGHVRFTPESGHYSALHQMSALCQ